MRHTVLAVALAASLVLPARAELAVVPVPEPTVRTIAGSGQSGTQDGAAAAASFIEPDGIAVAPNGTIYVADGGANTVRVIADGAVRILAGAPNATAGFADGPADAALFDRPVGVAVGPSGTVYVADSLNHRIRQIRNGVVSTLAGGAAIGKADGVGAAAAFTLPKGIAVDDAGTIYVADFGVGIRKISPAGSVSTMNVPTTGLVYAVAARGRGSDLIVDYTDNEGLHIVAGGKHRGIAIATEREPYSENNRIGNAFGIAIVDTDSAVITDLWTNAVRYVNVSDPPFRPASKTRTLAGGKRDGAQQIGGLRDGSTAEAMVKSPYGIAYSRDGRVFVADSGNRVVREIDGLDPRLPIASDLHNLGFPPHTYRIALIGDSYTWNNVVWPESMGGVLEAGLRANPAAFGTKPPPSVAVLSASGGTLGSASDFITTNLADGQADLVILVYDTLALGHEFETAPALRDGGWKTVIPARIHDLAEQLRKAGTKFALLPIPFSSAVSPVEERALHEDNPNPATYDAAANARAGTDFEATFASAGVHVIPLVRALAQAELQPATPSLYNTRDDHLTAQGSIAVGHLIVADLLDWRPWAAAPAKR